MILNYRVFILIVLSIFIGCDYDPNWRDKYYGKWEYTDLTELTISGFLDLYPDNYYSSTFSYWFTNDTSNCCYPLEGYWNIVDIGGPRNPWMVMYFRNDTIASNPSEDDSVQTTFNYQIVDSTGVLILKREGIEHHFELIENYEP
ncbi:MAG: hypothetical protein HQ528_06440 [Candidatus Marinimicrobia bacterium]|nr:hypothetical protein [Candidatus Neomarinimicrobiota bacterium]